MRENKCNDKLLNFSVIVPTLNSGKSLARTLESIYYQTYLPFEVIVVDGFSTDDTVQVFGRFRRNCDSLLKVPKSGPYAAMNMGIQHAKGQIVAILNSDDYWVSSNILQLVYDKFASNDHTLGIVHGNIKVQGKNGEQFDIVKSSTGWNYYCGAGLPFCHPATFIRRDFYLLFGLYNWISFPCQADRDLGFRLQRFNVKSIHIDQVLTVFCTGGLSCLNYDKDESSRILNTFPTLRRFVALCIGHLVSFHPAFYSGHRTLTLNFILKNTLRRIVRRILNLMPS